MADKPQISTPELSIDPEGNQCRFTVAVPNVAEFSFVVPWEDLEELFAKAAPYIEPRVAAIRRAEEERKRSEEERKRTHAQTVERANTVLAEVNRLRATGMRAADAWKTTAKNLGMSEQQARAFGQLARNQRRRSRIGVINALLDKGLSYREIAKRAKCSVAAVRKIATPKLTIKNARSSPLTPEPERGQEPSRETVSESDRRKALDAVEASHAQPQGSGREGKGEAVSSLPEPLPSGERRGSGGSAPGSSSFLTLGEVR